MVNGASFSPFLDVLQKITEYKLTEVVLPIAMKRTHVSALLTKDDFIIRSSVMSPVGYDREMTKLLHEHTTFVEEEENKKYPYDQFCKELSNIDKSYLLWGLYQSTYEVLDEKRKIKCTREDCGEEFTEKITLMDLIHDDTFTTWDEEEPFTEYNYEIEVADSAFTFRFLSRLPSIFDNNVVMGLLDTETLQYNIEKTGAIFTRPQQIALLCRAIQITDNETGNTVETNNIQEILMAATNAMHYTTSETFFSEYNKKFDKYNPNFYKPVQCPHCGNAFNYNITLDIEFFRRSLSGPESSE